MGDIAVRVEDILSETFKRQKLSAKGVPYYAQMLVGMTVFTGQYWADRPKVSKEQLAAYIVDLAWHGLSRLDSKPQLFFEGAKARKEAERRAKRESDSGARIQTRRVLPNRIPSTPPGKIQGCRTCVQGHRLRNTLPSREAKCYGLNRKLNITTKYVRT